MNPLPAELEQTYAEILKIVKVNVNFDRELTERIEQLAKTEE